MTFENKKEFHGKQAALPFEEKVRIMIELQKIDIALRPLVPGDRRMVWKLPEKKESTCPRHYSS